MDRLEQADLAGVQIAAGGHPEPALNHRRQVGEEWPNMLLVSTVDALERFGRPDSAASCPERIVSDPASTFDESHLRGIVIPFAHRRLVLLYARMGRLDDARRHWEVFSGTMRTPDPELQPLIEDAHDALRTAAGMALSTRR